jgi:hypothetical protein
MSHVTLHLVWKQQLEMTKGEGNSTQFPQDGYTPEDPTGGGINQGRPTWEDKEHTTQFECGTLHVVCVDRYEKLPATRTPLRTADPNQPCGKNPNNTMQLSF